MSQQVAVTIIATIKQEEIQNLRRLLKSMSDNVAHNEVIPFARLSNVHFARLLVLDESVDLNGVRIAPSLVYMSECDGLIDQHLCELVEIAAEGLDQLYSCCLDYLDSDQRTTESRLAYLRSKLVNANAYYVNTIGRTVQQIQQEAQLRNVIQNFLDHSRQGWSDKNPLEIRAAIQAFIDSEPGLRWAKKPPAQPSLFYRLKDTLHLIGVPLLLFVLLPLLVLVLPVWLILLRIHELTDAAPHIRPDEAHIRELSALEDIVVQNQFSAIGYFKSGWFRRLTGLSVLLLVNYSVRHFFNKGSLVGVKTIHFARWVAINEDRRMIFASNYDGALESYMDDFIDKVAWGLNAVFSNGIGYPKTNWLVFDGAKDEQVFKDFLRVHQLPTQVWYSAYDYLTAINIENNAKIRAGLSGKMSKSEVEEWLLLF
jgi:hypothetical protein